MWPPHWHCNCLNPEQVLGRLHRSPVGAMLATYAQLTVPPCMMVYCGKQISLSCLATVQPYILPFATDASLLAFGQKDMRGMRLRV